MYRSIQQFAGVSVHTAITHRAAHFTEQQFAGVSVHTAITHRAAHFTDKYQALRSNQWLRREHPRLITGRLPSHVTCYRLEETLCGASLASGETTPILAYRARGDTPTEGARDFGANFLVPFKF